MKYNVTVNNVLIIGGGMITNDLLLPSLYHLQRLGAIKDISICALNGAPKQKNGCFKIPPIQG